MKKWISLLLIAAMTLGMIGSLSACSSGGGASQTAEPAAVSGESSGPATDGSAKKVLKVGMECGYAPYNWTQPTDENGAVPIVDSAEYAYGYDVMMAKHIAEAIGYDLEIYKIDWDSLPMAVQSGKIDVAIAGQSITSDRKETVDFTLPYYYASVVALTTKGSPYEKATSVADLAGATCTSQINTIWYDVLNQIPEANILPAQETVPTMLIALNSGKVNLLVTDMPTAKAAAVAYSNMVIPELSEGFEVSQEEVEIGISLKKGNTELSDLINGVLGQMTESDFEKMMDEAISVQPLSEG